MKHKTKSGMGLVALALFALRVQRAAAQVETPSGPRPGLNIVVPQSQVFSFSQPGQIAIEGVEAGVVILEQAAVTTLDVSLGNKTDGRQEAELIVPVPEGAVVKSFSFQGEASESTAQILGKMEAKSTYEAIVRKIRDPALMEFAGYNLIRTSVFPLEPRSKQKVRLTYEHLLPIRENRVDYILPRTESLNYQVPWKITVRIKSNAPISTVYSPSHKIETVSNNRQIVSARLAADAASEPGPFRLSYLLDRGEVTASVYAYPDAKIGGGYFLLLSGLPQVGDQGRSGASIKREVTLVLDHSGSMAGEKFEQVRQAALQVLEGLEAGESMRLIVYNDTVDFFSPAPILKTAENMKRVRSYLKSVGAGGGTNIHAALLEALRTQPGENMLPIALFLTDGLPTVGPTSEAAIREVAVKNNPFNRRVFTFGAGVDVNAPLLDKIAADTRGAATYALPGEDVEVKVAGVFKKLTGPVLTDPEIKVADAKGKSAFDRVRELLPARVPDLFENDQLVLLGQYSSDQPLVFLLTGNYRGKVRAFKISFDPAAADARNAFVPRLWASRKIALLADSIRQSAPDGGAGLDQMMAGVQPGPIAGSDTKIREPVEEVVRLSKEFGILTEYTSFLALEGTDLSNRDQVMAQAYSNFNARAIQTRSGMAAVNQSANSSFMNSQTYLNRGNVYNDENMNRVSIASVQQVNDLSFFNSQGRWVDSRIVDRKDQGETTRVIEFGSSEFDELMERLARENRQGVFMLRGDVVLEVDGDPVLIKAPAGK